MVSCWSIAGILLVYGWSIVGLLLVWRRSRVLRCESRAGESRRDSSSTRHRRAVGVQRRPSDHRVAVHGHASRGAHQRPGGDRGPAVLRGAPRELRHGLVPARRDPAGKGLVRGRLRVFIAISSDEKALPAPDSPRRSARKSTFPGRRIGAKARVVGRGLGRPRPPPPPPPPPIGSNTIVGITSP